MLALAQIELIGPDMLDAHLARLTAACWNSWNSDKLKMEDLLLVFQGESGSIQTLEEAYALWEAAEAQMQG